MKVLDAKGNELHVGDRVEAARWGVGEVTGWSSRTPNAEGATLLAEFDGEEMPWHACPTEDPNTFTCPDLLCTERGGWYDSRPDTWEHIGEVRSVLRRVIGDLQRRADEHDRSKLHEPEVSVFNEFTPKLRDSTYGSDEYKEFLTGMGEGLKHHYAHNDHHPEHWPNGIHEMGLVELTEMLCDWLAATRRHADGDIRRSIEQNAERFGYGPEIKQLLLNSLPILEPLPKKERHVDGNEDEAV